MGRDLGSAKMCHLARMVDSTKAQVIFVSETKSSKIKPADLITRFNMNDSFVLPSRKRAGGLWLMWSDDLQLTMHSSNFYLILAIVTIRASNL